MLANKKIIGLLSCLVLIVETMVIGTIDIQSVSAKTKYTENQSVSLNVLPIKDKEILKDSIPECNKCKLQGKKLTVRGTIWVYRYNKSKKKWTIQKKYKTIKTHTFTLANNVKYYLFNEQSEEWDKISSKKAKSLIKELAPEKYYELHFNKKGLVSEVLLDEA